MTRNFRDSDNGCPMFGLDDQGKPGFDEKSDDCGACEEQDEQLFQACKIECSKATADYGEAPAGEQAAPPDETPAAEEKETEMMSTKKASKKATAPKPATPANAPKVEKAAKQAKAAKAERPEREPGVAALLGLHLASGVMTRKALIEKVQAEASGS